jgi:16S rRNA (uracil1498-N3)-methyltransferase
MTQFYLPADRWKVQDAANVRLEGDEARHARDAFRLQPGDTLRIFNGIGDAAEGRITACSKSTVDVAIERRLPKQAESTVRVSLAQSLVPNDTMDSIIRHATELGTFGILPVASDRSIIKLDTEKRRLKVEHWRATALAACKQSDRNTLPRILEVITGAKLIEQFKAYDEVLVACPVNPEFELDTWTRSATPPKSLLIAIGPEGDFSPEEMALYRKHGAKTVSLGPIILKSDTAALYALSVLQFLARNVDSKTRN